MLHIQNFSVSVIDGTESKQIVKNCSLSIRSGQVHLLIGPNGSGKSSLVYALMGHPAYQVTSGSIVFKGEQWSSDTATHVRSQRGLYLSMQQSEMITGLQVLLFLKEIWTIHHKKSISTTEFLDRIRPLLQQVGLPESILYRSVNDGFSGGEKKRFELLQMMVLQPTVCLLDEIDSGVDIDGLLLIAQSLQLYKKQYPDCSMLIVTHYRRILEYLQPDVVHVMMHGQIVATGGISIVNDIEQKGYEQYAKGFE